MQNKEYIVYVKSRSLHNTVIWFLNLTKLNIISLSQHSIFYIGTGHDLCSTTM